MGKMGNQRAIMPFVVPETTIHDRKDLRIAELLVKNASTQLDLKETWKGCEDLADELSTARSDLEDLTSQYSDLSEIVRRLEAFRAELRATSRALTPGHLLSIVGRIMKPDHDAFSWGVLHPNANCGCAPCQRFFASLRDRVGDD